MIKVDNRKVVAGIAADTYKAHWKRNIITVSAILMTTFLTAVVFALGFSYWNTVTLRTLRMNGMDYDVELSEPRPDQVDKIRAMEDVEAAGVSIKCAILERCGDIELDKTQLYWLDGVCWEKQCIPALEFYEGSYPERKEEIMLSESALTAMGIEHPETGMRLSMEYYPLSGDGNGKITSGDFILSGYFRDYTGRMKGYVSRPFLEESGAKQTDFTQGTLKISLKNPLYPRREIEKLQPGAALDRQVIKADYDTPVNFRKTAAGLAVMLFMVLSAGYLSIYNTLYISKKLVLLQNYLKSLCHLLSVDLQQWMKHILFSHQSLLVSLNYVFAYQLIFCQPQFVFLLDVQFPFDVSLMLFLMDL